MQVTTQGECLDPCLTRNNFRLLVSMAMEPSGHKRATNIFIAGA